MRMSEGEADFGMNVITARPIPGTVIRSCLRVLFEAQIRYAMVPTIESRVGLPGTKG